MKLMNKQVHTWFYSQTQITELKIRNGLTSLFGRKAMTNLDRSLVGYSPWGREESDRTEQLRFDFSLSCIEMEMATHSSILAWRIPGMREPGGLLSMESHRVGHD